MTPFNKCSKNMMHPWCVLAYVLFMFVLFLYIDAPVALFFHHIELGSIQPLSEGVTILGEIKPLLGILLVSAVVCRYLLHWRQWEMRAWFLCLCTFIPSALVLGLKIIFGRARPELLFTQGIYGFQWMQYSRPFWSFPSGHTATLMGCVFGLCIVWPRYRWVFLSIGFVVMLSRVLLLQHYISDVMVSAYLACIEVWVLQFMLHRYAPSFMKKVAN
ncbi:MAG: phosphatase PAP2 family protein [Gammaproteobacteria bacterium]|nr:phosphatase PAP2 family protein [Gammaproteobacteria bacterium]